MNHLGKPLSPDQLQEYWEMILAEYGHAIPGSGYVTRYSIDGIKGRTMSPKRQVEANIPYPVSKCPNRDLNKNVVSRPVRNPKRW